MSASSINLRHLRYFIAIVEQGTFRAAALRLHVSQPPLTRQIKQLEAVMQTTLLVRKPRGVEMTAAGQVFYREARNIVRLTEQAVRQAQLTANGQTGRLDIGIFGSAIFGAIPRITRAFQSQYPRAEVSLYTMDRSELLRALRERRVSVGFNRFFQREPDLTWERIQTEHINVALDHQHPLAAKEQLSLAEIVSEPLIMYPRAPRPGYADHVLNLFKRKELTPLDTLNVDDVSTAIALVASGVGLALVPDSARNLKVPGVVYRPLMKRDNATLDLCIIYRSDDEDSLLKRFLDVARALQLDH